MRRTTGSTLPEIELIGIPSRFVLGMVQAVTVSVLIWVKVSVTAQHIRSSCAGLTRVSIDLQEKSLFKKRVLRSKMDCRAGASGSDAVLRTAMPGNDGGS